MNDARFWEATERAEGDFTGRADVVEFRRRMRRLGHEDPAIRDRVESIRPELLEQFDELPSQRPRGCASCHRPDCEGECLG